jgi:hypothetical protein
LSKLLSANSEKTLLRNLADQVASAVTVVDLVGLMAKHGGGLLAAGGFTSNPDGASRHIVMPLLNDQSGREWLYSRADELKSVVANAEADTKGAIAELLGTLGSAAAEAEQEQLGQLRTSWGLSSPGPKPENSEG